MATLYPRVPDVFSNFEHRAVRKLASNACHEQASVTGITAASREEEARRKMPLLLVIARDGSSYR